MYVRAINFDARVSVSAEQAGEIYRLMVSLLEEMEGFLGSSLFLNEGTRQGLSLTYWIDQDHANEGGKKSLPVLLEQIGNLVDRPPVITGYDVLDETRTGIRR